MIWNQRLQFAGLQWLRVVSIEWPLLKPNCLASSLLFCGSSLALNGGGCIFHSPSSPLFSLLALLSRLFSSIERLSLHCSSNWKIMDLINWSLNAIDTIFSTRSLGSGEPDCPDGMFAAGRVGEVADRVSSGSFRGGHWRYLLIRNHDNRSSADWIRLCPGLSKNSENGNSCPKPHKAARHDWSSGKSGQHWDWDY